MNDNLSLPALSKKVFLFNDFFNLWISFEWSRTWSALVEFEFRIIIFSCLSSAKQLSFLEFKLAALV